MQAVLVEVLRALRPGPSTSHYNDKANVGLEPTIVQA